VVAGPAATVAALGALELALKLPGGAQLAEVAYVVDSGSLGIGPQGTLQIESDLAVPSAYIGQLTPGSHQIHLRGTAVGNLATCEGSAAFTVAAGQTISLTVPLRCQAPDLSGSPSFDTTRNDCPILTSVTVSPLVTELGSPVRVSAQAADANGAAVQYSWTSARGAFAQPAQATTQYTCLFAGSDVLTVTVDDGAGCSVSQSVLHDCLP